MPFNCFEHIDAPTISNDEKHTNIKEFQMSEMERRLRFIVVTFLAFIPGLFTSADKKDRTSAVYPGDFIIGALFAIHHQPTSAQHLNCGAVREMYGIQRVEVTFQALDMINADPNLLPNITLGAEIRDSCWYAPVALQQTIELVRDSITPYDQQTCLLNDNPAVGAGGGGGGGGKHVELARRRKPPLVGVLGPGASSVAMQVQNLLQLFSIPQVAYSATSRDLSDKDRYSTFFRVVPSDYHQARLLVDLVRYHNWTFVSAIHTDENYGQSGMAAFKEVALKKGVCIAKEDRILSTAADKDFDAVIDKIHPGKDTGPESRTHVVVCFCEGKTVRGLLAAIHRKKLAGELLIVGSDGWADRSDVAPGYEREAHGSISVRIHSPYVHYFDHYYQALKPYNNTRNPWFKEFWQSKFKCSLGEDSGMGMLRYNNHTKENQADTDSGEFMLKTLATKNCTGLESLTSDYNQDPKLNFIVRGLYAMAHALHNMQRKLCGAAAGICARMIPFNGTLYKSFLYNVSFRAPNGGIVAFDNKGDPPGSNSVYDIMNYQRVGNAWGYVQVGIWVDGDLSFSRNITYSGAGGSVTTDHTRVHSVCSKPCASGYIKSGDAEKRCCWSCIECPAFWIQINETACKMCAEGSYPDINKTHCILSPIEYVQWTDSEAVVAISFACLGFLATTFTAAVFIKYNNTPVVKSSTRELSYIILFGMIVSHASVFAILAKPTDISCTLSRTLPGISFAMIYASIFTKTNRIARILAGSKKRFPSRKLRFMSGTAQVVISMGLTLVAASVCGYTILSERPVTHLLHPSHARAVLACKLSANAVLMPLSPALALLAACAALAIRTRALPQNFNEAKFIGVATYTTCVIWIAFFPIYFGSESKTITLCICVTLSATVTLMFLFFPRLYIVLLHPERNNRAHFITSRSIRCHIGRAFGDARSHHQERDEILSMDFHRKADLRTISCQTSMEQLPQYVDSLDEHYIPQYISPDWAELDPKPFLDKYKCENQNQYNMNINVNSPSKNPLVIRSNPISLSLDVSSHTRIREETVSECSLTDDDSMTQIKDITITLGLSTMMKNRAHCCKDIDDKQVNTNQYF